MEIVGSRLSARLGEERIRLLRRLGEIAAARGEGLYLIGGPVRDLLIDRNDAGLDLDLAVEGEAIAFAMEAASTLDATVTKTHPDFGTATLRLVDGQKLDLAMTRTETYPHPAALPVVRPASIWEDLARRDFTMNALAIDLTPDRFGALLDPCGGHRDLDAGILRILHGRSFVDDPTRLFRAVRFEQRFRFRLSEGTEAALRSALAEGWPRHLSGPRVRQELARLLEEAEPTCPMRRTDEIGLLAGLALPLAFPELAARRFECAAPLFASFGWEPGAQTRTEALWLLWLDTLGEETVRAAVEWMKLGNRLGDALARWWARVAAIRETLRANGPFSRAYGLLHGLSEALVFALVVVVDAPDRGRLLDWWNRAREVRPYITGEDLKEMGFTPGPAFGTALEATLNAQLDGRIASREEAREFACRTMTRLLAEGPM